jgi:hypothetical protein
MLGFMGHVQYVRFVDLAEPFHLGKKTMTQANNDNEELRQQIQAQLVELQRLWPIGNTDRLAAELFSERIEVCGEGAPSATVGADAFREVLGAMISDTPAVEVSLVKCARLGEEAALTWLIWKAVDRLGTVLPPMRSLTVWENDGGWKIRADMYTAGQFYESNS